MHCNEEDKALHMPIQCFAWGNGKHCIKIPTKTNCRYTCHPHKSSRAPHPTSESPPHRLGKQWKTWDTIKYEPTMYAFGYYLNVRVLTSHTRSPTIRNNFLPRLPSRFINFYGEKNCVKHVADVASKQDSERWEVNGERWAVSGERWEVRGKWLNIKH